LGGSELRDEQGYVRPYFDRRYGCEMEVLEFDSRQVNPIFEVSVKGLCDYFLGRSAVEPGEAQPFVSGGRHSTEQNIAGS
jgi:hypothetical protein